MANTSPKPCTDVPKKLYHATDATLAPGDVIVPGRECGRGRGQFVWMDASASTAWGPNVYEVQPEGNVEEARGAFRAPRAIVKRVHITEEGTRVGRALGFSARYATAMLAAERAKCVTCTQPISSHAFRFVREACDRLKVSS